MSLSGSGLGNEGGFRGGRAARFSDVLIEDPPDLRDALRVAVGPVVAGHDDFTLRAIEVAAPVWHDAIGTLGRRFVLVATLAPVGDDRVIRDAFYERDGVDGGDEAVVRVE